VGHFGRGVLGKTFHGRFFGAARGLLAVKLMSEAISRSKQTHERGVTLFEVLIVVAILALVAAGVSVAAIKFWIKAQYDTATSNARSIRQAVPLWWAQHDSAVCPEIGQLVSDGILDDDTPAKDPWGMPWRIECNELKVTVSSSGGDKIMGTKDDIRVPPATS
jgi:general secretion pathway protein G